MTIKLTINVTPEMYDDLVELATKRNESLGTTVVDCLEHGIEGLRDAACSEEDIATSKYLARVAREQCQV